MDLPNASDPNNTHNKTLLPTSSFLKDNHAANGHLVYVRRKSEGETPKNTSFDNTSQLYSQQEIALPNPQIKEPKLSCFPASPNPSIPASLANSTIIFSPLDSNHVAPSSRHTIANPNVFTNVNWEHRYQQLHLFLRKLDQSNQPDYIQMLQSLSSIELSRHAVELEKRSIQLSLEEAKELQRVAALNVLGKSGKNFKAPVDHGECSDKLKTST